jgi:hypothetical protein
MILHLTSEQTTTFELIDETAFHYRTVFELTRNSLRLAVASVVYTSSLLRIGRVSVAYRGLLGPIDAVVESGSVRLIEMSDSLSERNFSFLLSRTLANHMLITC